MLDLEGFILHSLHLPFLHERFTHEMPEYTMLKYGDYEQTRKKCFAIFLPDG